MCRAEIKMVLSSLSIKAINKLAIAKYMYSEIFFKAVFKTLVLLLNMCKNVSPTIAMWKVIMYFCF